MSSAEKKKFISDLVWVRDLLKGDLKEVYRQAKLYQALGDEGSASVLWVYLSQWAIDKQFPEAKYDLIQEDFKESSTPGSGRMLSHLAGSGYLPAMLDAARRFSTGDGVEKDRGKAYYWLKRAQFSDGEVLSILKTPYELFSLDMSALEWESLKFESMLFLYKSFNEWFSDLSKDELG